MTNLAAYLASRTDEPVALAVLGIAAAAVEIADEIRLPGVALDEAAGAVNSDGDTQKKLDVIADELVLEAVSRAGVAAYLSEERDDAIDLDPDGQVIVACDPLDGSSNIGVNLSVGTIFSVLPADQGHLQPGRSQLAAGYVVYGPQTTMLVTVGKGTASFRMDSDGVFQLVEEHVQIPATTSEFAINMSNHRHWQPAIRRYVDGCLAGEDGDRGRNFNMRWVASLVADGWRIFTRGGVFLYPADQRKGYEEGRLRYVYEAAPVAFLVEQAGGVCTTGVDPVMDVVPAHLHQRVPLIFGSAEEVQIIIDHCRAGGV